VGDERRSDQKLQLSEKLGTGTRLQKNGWQKNEDNCAPSSSFCQPFFCFAVVCLAGHENLS
jgi:hypothetical protein